MGLYILSDLHIQSPKDATYARLLAFLERVPQSGDRVVFAGDIFDLFVGSDDWFRKRYESYFSSLRDLIDRGVSIDYIEGNHDFFVGEAYAALPAVRVHAEELAFEWEGKKILINHGDKCNPDDVGYLLLRSGLRSPVVKGFIKMAPGRWIHWLGDRASQLSRAKSRYPERAHQESTELRRPYRAYAVARGSEGYDIVVLGHCHDLDEANFSVGDRTLSYWNVGYPPRDGKVLGWDSVNRNLMRYSFD